MLPLGSVNQQEAIPPLLADLHSSEDDLAAHIAAFCRNVVYNCLHEFHLLSLRQCARATEHSSLRVLGLKFSCPSETRFKDTPLRILRTPLNTGPIFYPI